jgi:hypothetical protein
MYKIILNVLHARIYSWSAELGAIEATDRSADLLIRGLYRINAYSEIFAAVRVRGARSAPAEKQFFGHFGVEG